jgi:soluble lytic murein transglycosylase
MQLMPDTAEWIAGKLRVSGYAFERMYDPESNIRFGCWYLNYLSRLFLGDPAAVTAAYHAGQGQVKVWLSDPVHSDDGYSLRIDTLQDGPTKQYAGRVLRDYGIYRAKYFSEDLLLDGGDPSAVSFGRFSLLGGNR